MIVKFCLNTIKNVAFFKLSFAYTLKKLILNAKAKCKGKKIGHTGFPLDEELQLKNVHSVHSGTFFTSIPGGRSLI